MSEQTNAEINTSIQQALAEKSPGVRASLERKKFEDESPLYPKTLNELHDVYRKWYDITNEDMDVIDAVLVVACERRIPGDPLWMFLIGPSGYLKTGLCRSISKIPEVYQLDKMTNKTLISGAVEVNEEGERVPIAGIMQHLDQRVLVMKDFTAILSMKQEVRDEVMGQLRGAYDGYLEQAYGTLPEPIRVKASFGFLGAVTPVLDRYTKILVVMGPRTLSMRLHGKNYVAAATKAMANAGNEEKMREEISTAAAHYVNRLKWSSEHVPQINEAYTKRIVYLATYTAFMRTHVFAKYYRGKITLTEIPTVEAPTRIAKQMAKLIQGLATIRGRDEVTKEDYDTILRVAKDSAIPEHQRIMNYFLENGLNKDATTSDLSKHTKMSFQSTENYAMLMASKGILTYTVKDEGDGKYPQAWRVTDDFKKIINKTALIQGGTN